MINPIRSARARYVTAVAVLILLPTIFTVAPAGAASTSETRATVAGLISAAVKVSPSLTRLEAGLQMVPAAPC